MIELGSGLGDLGWKLYKLGGHVTCTEIESVMQVLDESLARKHSYQPPESNDGTIRTVPLAWGEEGYNRSPLSQEHRSFDVIIVSECYFFEDFQDMLIWSISKLCDSTTVVWSVFQNRPFSWLFFAKLHDFGGFEVEQVDNFDNFGMEEVYLHKFTKNSETVLCRLPTTT